MTNNQTHSDTELRELVQQLEVKSTIAMHKSMQDGSPIHHEEFIDWAVNAITAKLTEARIDENDRLLTEADDMPCKDGHLIPYEEIEGYVNNRIATLQSQETRL